MTVRGFFEFLHRRRVAVQIAFVVLVTAAYAWQTHYSTNVALDDIEYRVSDWRMRIRPPRARPDKIIIIGLEESAFPKDPWRPNELARAPELAYLTNSWPWSRALWGKLAEKLFNAGARFVGYDFLFTGSMPGDEECGAVFEKYADRIAITAQLGSNRAEINHELSNVITYPEDDLVPLKGPDIVGLANYPIDADGIERRLQNGYSTILLGRPDIATDQSHPELVKPDMFSFAWLSAQKVRGSPPPRDPTTTMLVNFYGEKKTIETVYLEDVLLNWDSTYKHGEYFKDKIVFVGPLSEVRFKDDHPTPMGMLPGVEIQATAVANLVNGDWLREAPEWVSPLVAAGLGLLSLLVCLRVHSVLAKVGLLIGLGVLFLVVTQWLFTSHLLIVPVVGAFIGVVGCGGFGTMYDFVLERYERRRMLGVFESMVSPGVAGLVLSHRDDFEKRLGGQRRDVVVLFCDIRGFTTWSEKVGPDALVAQLNEYFFEMVEAIQGEGGTVQKYIGDALMAAWGDVREQPLPECALQSLRAAFDMMDALKKLNVGWVGQPKREPLAIGIGINLGEGLIGRIGHPRRQEFTVMGDAVNLAARLESATKQYHQTILVGQHIHDLTKGQFYFRLVDKMQVKGKTVAVPVYAPLGPRPPAPPAPSISKSGLPVSPSDLAAPPKRSPASPSVLAGPPPGLPQYDAAIEKYYARDFTAAAELFKSANEKMGGGDFLCENYLERCATYLREPPPPDWDGAWVLKEK